MGRDSRWNHSNLGTGVWYVKNKGGLDLTSVSRLIVKWSVEDLVRGVRKTTLGNRPFRSLQKKNSKHKILLVQSFKVAEG
jgi:hypothetical protein